METQARCLIHPHRKQWGILRLLRKSLDTALLEFEEDAAQERALNEQLRRTLEEIERELLLEPLPTAQAVSIFRRALVAGIIRTNPTQDLKLLDIPPFRTRRLEPTEERRLFKALPQFPPYIEAVSIIALNTGMRAGEIARLAIEDIDFVRNRLFVREAKWKGDKRQSEGLPLNATVRALLWKM